MTWPFVFALESLAGVWRIPIYALCGLMGFTLLSLCMITLASLVNDAHLPRWGSAPSTPDDNKRSSPRAGDRSAQPQVDTAEDRSQQPR